MNKDCWKYDARASATRSHGEVVRMNVGDDSFGYNCWLWLRGRQSNLEGSLTYFNTLKFRTQFILFGWFLIDTLF